MKFIEIEKDPGNTLIINTDWIVELAFNAKREGEADFQITVTFAFDLTPGNKSDFGRALYPMHFSGNAARSFLKQFRNISR
jgi:hypothetical protein